MMMAVTRTLLRAATMKGLRPAESLHEVNQVLRMEKVSSMFVTCFHGVLDTRTGEFEYSNAGHNPPYLIRADGTLEPTELTGGLVMGPFARATYKSKKVRLAPGESLCMYTDGVTEAMNAKHEEFSDERLRSLLIRLHGSSAEQCVRAVMEDVNAFADGAAQSDDITMFAIKYAGKCEGEGC